MTKDVVKQQEPEKVVTALTVEQFLEAAEKKSKIPEVVRIENSFNRAFSGLSERAKSLVIEKPLSIGIENYEGMLFKCNVNEDGAFAIFPVFDDIIEAHYLKNRFVIKETDSDLLITAPRIALQKGIACVGAVETIEKLKEDKSLLLCVMGEDGVPILYPSKCEDLNIITRLSKNIYLVQQKDVLAAVVTGVIVDTMESGEEEQGSLLDYDRSYV